MSRGTAHAELVALDCLARARTAMDGRAAGPVTLPAYVYDGTGTHRHGTDEPGWVQHDHLGGGVPHAHDPETGFQVGLDESPEGS